MAYPLSEPVENLIEESGGGPTTDVLIVGSGYGGAVAALRLANRDEGRRVYVLERGNEYAPGDFPRGLGELPGHVRYRRPSDSEAIGYPHGLFDFRFGDDVDVLVGNGLGGTSLINANVAEEPEPDVFQQHAWPATIRQDFAAPSSDLKEGYARIRELLQVTEAGRPSKYGALEKLSTGIGAACRPAAIAVTPPSASGSLRNAVGVAQAPCTLCGNCVTGCNVGAKNTLAMNAIPLAKARGARFFTGATVLDLEREEVSAEHPWAVRFRRTVSEKTPLAEETYVIRAKVAILAAGTLGSTEILLRTQAQGRLRFSVELGQRFSTNGDAIAMGFAQAAPVNAIGREDELAASDVGPTICGIARATVADPQTGAATRLAIEDGAVPAALARIFGEIVTTGAQLHRLASCKLPAWLKRRDGRGHRPDPVAVQPEALQRSQVLLIMGDDGAGGHLELAHGSEAGLDNAQVRVVWPDAGDNPALRSAHALLSAHNCGPGFDGGQYVPNPLWRALPDDAAAVMSGGDPGGRVMTVHPLGGCPMGENIDGGVVDHAGRVFAADSDSTFHEGLYVLDGAIVPTALAVNPLLTIGALAWRASGLLLREYGWTESDCSRVAEDDMRSPIPHETVRRPAVAPEVHVTLYELLIGQLDSSPERVATLLPLPSVERWSGRSGLIIRVAIDIDDMDAWLGDPGARPLRARANLYSNPITAEEMRARGTWQLPRTLLAGVDPLVVMDGTVTLLGIERVSLPRRLWRTVGALRAYFARRQSLWSLLQEWLAGKMRQKDESAGPGSRGRRSWWEQLRGYLAVGRMHADYRTLRYAFETTDQLHDFELTLKGVKRLAWQKDNLRVWDALLTLPVELGVRRAGNFEAVRGTLMLDMEHVATDGLPQVRSAPHLPAALAALGGLGMFFTRAILQTSFWEFGAPPYPGRAVEQRPEPRALRAPDGSTVTPETTRLHVPLARRDERTVPIVLTRYRSRRVGAHPVLLIHGLAQGSLIYATDTMEKNMATAMWEAGYDVWLLDYRLSNALIRSIPDGGWSMEEIARYDIPAAIEHVHVAAGRRPLRVFAHCVGATVIAMAVLRGWVPAGRLERVAFNAIHPWIDPSPINRFRAALGILFRDVVGSDMLDPVLQVEPEPRQVLFDRLAYSLARFEEEPGDRHAPDASVPLARGICDRMSFLYGRMWRHVNLDERTHAAFGDLVGPAPGDVYRHLYYFAKRGRLTDREGRNAFLRASNIRERWMFPTLFFHGEASNVFNPQSATESAVRFAMVLGGEGGAFDAAKGKLLVRRVEQYGHMDIVFGARAAIDVYPTLISFFAHDPAEPLPSARFDAYGVESVRHSRVPLNPMCGPVLRAAWVEDGRVHLRFWTELHDATTMPIRGVQVASRHVMTLREWRIRGCEPSYRLIDVAEKAGAHDIRLNLQPSTAPGGVDTVGNRESDGKSERQLNQVQAGSDSAELLGPPWSEVVLRGGLDWLARLRQRARGGGARDTMSFLVGSCRYPGTPFERDAADAVFAGMLQHAIGEGNTAQGVDAVFFVGDQIYADATAAILDATVWRERYSLRYREAFNSRHLRQLLMTVPTHFAVDDHEFADGWSGLPPAGGALTQDNDGAGRHRLARRAARSFLGSGRESKPVTAESGRCGALWYPLSHAHEMVCPAFVMDTRSERELRMKGASGLDARIAGRAQWEALERWLREANRIRHTYPKFIFSSSVIAPVSRDFSAHEHLWRREDGWAGYPASLRRIVEVIVEEGIRSVVFVGGDLHLSAVGRLQLQVTGRVPVTAWQIVASGLYSPLPFANRRPESFDWNVDHDIPVAGGAVSITANVGLLCAGPPHFVRVDSQQVDGGWTLRIGAHDASGGRLAALTVPPPQVRQDAETWVLSL